MAVFCASECQQALVRLIVSNTPGKLSRGSTLLTFATKRDKVFLPTMLIELTVRGHFKHAVRSGAQDNFLHDDSKAKNISFFGTVWAEASAGVRAQLFWAGPQQLSGKDGIPFRHPILRDRWSKHDGQPVVS